MHRTTTLGVMLSCVAMVLPISVLADPAQAGCRRVCRVRTPLGFQPGGAPATIAGTWFIDSYGFLEIRWSATRHESYSNQSFYYGNYSRCTSGVCLQSNENTSSDKRQWYNSYFAGNPANDGRKVYWNSQSGSVAQAENPGTSCIGYGGGHTSAVLQALDDNGRFIGLIGAEASFDRPAYLQDEVGAWTAVKPVLVSTFSTLP